MIGNLPIQRVFWILLCALPAAGLPAPAAGVDPASVGPGELMYIIRPSFDGEGMRLAVDLYFRGDPSGTTTIVLPSEWGGQTRLYRAVRLEPDPNLAVRDTGTAHRKRVEHDPDQVVQLRYYLEQDWEELRLEEGNPYRPFLNPEYFHFIGHAAFVLPEWNPTRPTRIRIRWDGFPPGWALANSFGTREKVQEMEISILQLQHAIYVGGDFRIHEIPLPGGNRVHVAMRGEWEFPDREFLDLARNVVRSQRFFWNDPDFPYFLITLIPTGVECCSYGGTGLTDSFATFISTDRGIDLKLKFLLGHELLHTWIGGKITIPDRPDEPEALMYWFTEGFADFYARELLSRAGLITRGEYLEDLNRRIYEYYLSSARNLPNSRIPDRYWSEREVNHLPYRRGDLLARRWDAAIRSESGGRHSLDDAMRDLLARSGKKGFELSDESVNRSVERFLGRDVRDDLRRFIHQGKTIVPPAELLGGEFVLRMTEMGPFELGFDFDRSSREGVISGVRRGGPAHRAGLRNGYLLRGYGVRWNDIGEEVKIQFEEKEGAGLREVRYLPMGEVTKIPQYVEASRPAGE